jgi:amidase
MFQAMVGPDPRDPIALPHTGEDWARAADGARVRGLRVAWTPDLGGAAPVEPEVARLAEAGARVFRDLGAELEDGSPEIGEIRDPFVALNAAYRQATVGAYLDRWRDEMDPILVRRLEMGRGLTGADIGRAEVARTAYHQRLRRFFERHDLLLCPAAAITARPLDAPMPGEIAGRPIRDHLDMMPLTFAFNVSGYPAISVPCGFDADGLPVGLQIVGGFRQDALVLAAAAGFEAARPWSGRRPPAGT